MYWQGDESLRFIRSTIAVSSSSDRGYQAENSDLDAGKRVDTKSVNWVVVQYPSLEVGGSSQLRLVSELHCDERFAGLRLGYSPHLLNQALFLTYLFIYLFIYLSIYLFIYF